MDQQVLYGFAGVFLGWILGQGASIATHYVSAARRKRGLVEELQDIDYTLDRVILHAMRCLQILALGGSEGSVPAPIRNFFFRQNFELVFSSLSREQRLSYQLIHGLVEALNKQFLVLERARERCYEINLSGDTGGLAPAIEEWGDVVKSIFTNAKVLRWHIRHHLSNPNLPILEFRQEEHDRFVQVHRDCEMEIKKILEAARSLSREDFA